MKIQDIQFSPDSTSIGFTSATGGTTAALYSADLNGGNQIQVTPNNLARGVTGFQFTPDSQSFVYWADQKTANVPELFKVGKDGVGSLQLNSPLTNGNQALNYKISFSADGSLVYYQDGHQPTFVDNEMSLSAVPLNGGTPLILSPAPTGPDVSVQDYLISKKWNKVAFLM